MNRSRAGLHRQLSPTGSWNDVAGARGRAVHVLHSAEVRSLLESCALVLAAGVAAALLVGSAGCASGTWNAEEPTTRDARPPYPFRKNTRVGQLSPAAPGAMEDVVASRRTTDKGV